MIVFSHPLGNANVREAVMSLQKAGILSEFHTSIASFPGNFLSALGSVGPFSEIKRRSFDPSLEPYTHMWPWVEIGRQISLKAGMQKLSRHEKGLFCVDAVYRALDRRVGTRISALGRRVKGVYAYDDGAAFSFAKAKMQGIQCLYDLPIGYWRASQRLLKTEMERRPEWAATLESFHDSVEKLERKDEELRLADRIFVASSFTAETLREYPGQLAPVEVIPYGFPAPVNERTYRVISRGSKLKLLYVGALSQRKGIANIFEAVSQLSDFIELTVVGLKTKGKCDILDEELRRHRWIPSLSHSEVLQLMGQHDVLLFPSLFEGFGLVITEAMSQGTPVITTARTAGPDIINHTENGWLVEAGSTESLKAAIDEILIRPESIACAGRAARASAMLRPWSVYQKELIQAIERHFAGHLLETD